MLYQAHLGNVRVVDRWLRDGGDVNATDADNMGTLLIGAASACSSELVELLLAHGADLGATDRWGCTALAAACSGGGTASKDSRGSTDPPSRSSATPAMRAAVVSMLVGSGADVDVQDQSGLSPLMVAASAGELGVVKQLLDAGARRDLTDSDGRTAVSLAAKYERRAVVKLLKAPPKAAGAAAAPTATAEEVARAQAMADALIAEEEGGAADGAEASRKKKKKDKKKKSGGGGGGGEPSAPPPSDPVPAPAPAAAEVAADPDPEEGVFAMSPQDDEHQMEVMESRLRERGRRRAADGAAADGGAARVQHIAGDFIRCPITMELMRDPVFTCDGHTFERSAIERWLRKHGTSPLTGEPLPTKALTPNNMARSMVRQYVAAHPSLPESTTFNQRLFNFSGTSDDDTDGTPPSTERPRSGSSPPSPAPSPPVGTGSSDGSPPDGAPAPIATADPSGSTTFAMWPIPSRRRLHWRARYRTH